MHRLRAIVPAAAVGIAVMAAPAAAAMPGYQPCPSPQGYQIEVMGASCADSWLFDAYNFDEGDKYQQFANSPAPAARWTRNRSC